MLYCFPNESDLSVYVDIVLQNVPKAPVFAEMSLQTQQHAFHYLPPVPFKCLRSVRFVHICQRRLCLSRLHLFYVLFFQIIDSCDAVLYFQHHYSSIQCHMILQKSLQYADMLLKKTKCLYLYQSFVTL